MTDFLSIKDKNIIVIGGCGNLGSVICNHLSQLGSKVVCIDKNHPDDINKKIIYENYFYGDISDEASMKKCLNLISAKNISPDGVIIAAAIDTPPNIGGLENGPIETSPIEYFTKIIDVNLTGSYIAGKIFGSAMAKVGKGSIIFINSIYGIVSPRQEIYEFKRKTGVEFYKPPAYSVSKSGLSNLKRYLATYWAKSGLRVNEIILGGVFNNQDSEFVNAYCSHVPMGRMAAPDEIIGALVLLLSDASSYITGSSITIDGGYTSW